jgi:hypothetical protein
VGGRQGPAVHTIPSSRAAIPATPGSSIGVVNNFRGDDLATQLAAFGSDNAAAPPDTTLGVGNGFVVEPLNDSVSVYKSTGQFVGGADLNAFLSSPSGHSVTDPQVVFDSVTTDHRFYMTMLGFDPSTFDSEVLLAVSKTSDPTGSWNQYSLGTTSGMLQDQPFLGLSDDKLTISVNDSTTSQFLGGATYVLNKADADAGATIHQQSFGPELAYFRPSPARSTSATTTQYVVSNDSPSLHVMAITGVPTATTTALRTVTTLTIAATAIPPDGSEPSQPFSIATDDTRTLEAVWQSNVLWVGANDGCLPSNDNTERSCLRLIELAAPISGTPSVTQDVDVSATGVDLYYPGVALDKSQNLYVPSTFSDDSTAYPSGQVLAFAGGDPASSAVTTLHSGTYYNGPESTFPTWRWGDYSGAAIDPSNPTDVWVATEFGGGDTGFGTGTNWATQLSQVTISPTLLPRSYHPLTPARITDTRTNSGAPNASSTLGAGGALDVRVAGAGGLPITGATAAVLNVTVTNPTQPSFLTVWPARAAQPIASNLNFGPGQTVANLVEVGLGDQGAVSVYNSAGSVDVVVDVQGYVGPSASAGAGLYNPLTPARITDTRPGSDEPNAGMTLGQGSILNVKVTGAGGVPATGVAAAVLNVTATNPTKQSFLTVWPTGAAQPLASDLNFAPGQTVPNRVIVPVGTGGTVSIFNLAGSVDVVVDVGGFFTDSSSVAATRAQFTPTTPARITDTRSSSGPNAGNTLGPGGVLTVQVSGAGGVPATGVTAAVLNVTVTNTTQPSFLTVWPTGATRPSASDLNWVAGQTVPNLTVVKLGSDGAVQVFNPFGSVDVVVDVSGWYS